MMLTGLCSFLQEAGLIKQALGDYPHRKISAVEVPQIFSATSGSYPDWNSG